MQGFDPDVTDTQALQDTFASCGAVKSTVLVKGPGGQPTLAAYIHFEDHLSAKASSKAHLMMRNPFSLKHRGAWCSGSGAISQTWFTPSSSAGEMQTGGLAV